MTDREKKDKIANKLINLLGILGIIIVIVVFYYSYKAGLLTDSKKMEEFLRKTGPLAPLVFFVIQIIQTVVPIIPGALTIPAGELIFGPLKGFLLNYVSIVIGSIMAFYICRKYGRRLLWILIGEKAYEKYVPLLDTSIYNRLFIIGMLVPFMPADVLCMVSGVSNMKFKDFLIILVVCKPVSLYLYTVVTVFASKWLINYIG